MSYTVSATDLSSIRLAEPDRVKEILRNIALILATPKGSVPLDREFGLDTAFLDRPRPVAEVMMRAPVREAVETWEPRASVVDIEFRDDSANPGKSIPIVEVEIRAES